MPGPVGPDTKPAMRMPNSQRDVLVTGIGLASSLGEGVAAHFERFTASDPLPSLERALYAPYSVHPLPEIDWSKQIPKRGDQRQMETWQRLGTYAAGLALEDAGVPADEGARSTIDMVVAAGGGERDMSVDAMVMERARKTDDVERVINETLSTELRPTLFLAQLSNLLAGNISIVHKVTGSSRTFMGEEAAGISALQSVRARIASGQSEIALVGSAFSAERKDLILNFDLAELMLKGEWKPVLARQAGQDGIAVGSVGAFLVLESREHAEARGARAYAKLMQVQGDRGRREGERMKTRLARVLPTIEDGADTLVLSGASGLASLNGTELEALNEAYPEAARIAYGTLTGHSFEAQMPMGVALAAAALREGARFSLTDPHNERAVRSAPKRAVVTSIGHLHAEGACHLETANGE